MAVAAQVPLGERIEVTGSHIRRVDAEGPAPTTILTREDLERRGGQNLSEVLTTLPYATSSFTEAQEFGNSFAPGTSGLALHGLGVKSTLVLLDGRRAAPYAFAQDISVTFVDLNSIPMSAIERIEILRDGASAIYGSDAMAGVVNIILRKDFSGLEARAGYAASGHGDAQEYRGTLIWGRGTLAKDRYNVMASLDYYIREPLFGGDRDDWTSSTDTRAFGGFDGRSQSGSPGTWLTNAASIPAAQRRPTPTPFPDCPETSRANGFCMYDFRPDTMTVAETRRASGFANARLEISSSLSLFAQGYFSDTETWRQLAASPDGFTLPVGHLSNPFPFAVPIAYRFVDVGPRRTLIDSRSSRVVAGVSARTGRWDWDAAWLHGRVDASERSSNFISIPARNGLVAGNRYDFVRPATNDPALVESLRASPVREGRGEMSSVDLRASGSALDLPAGPLGVAAGMEWRRESLLDVPDERARAGLIAGVGTTRVDAAREVRAAFVEVSVPIVSRLEAQLAARRDDYADAGAEAVPKYALAWRATDDLLLRAGYNRGFRAPSLPELHAGATLTFTSLVDTTRCAAYRSAFGTGDSRTTASCARADRRVTFSGNPSLFPETSRAWHAGLVWSPGALSIAADAYDIRFKDRIQSLGPQVVIDNEHLFPGLVNRLPPSQEDIAAGAPGMLASGLARPPDEVAVSSGFVNTESTHARGVDFEFRLVRELGGSGRIDISSINNYVDTLEFRVLPGSAPLSRAGPTGGWPRYRGIHTLGWRRGPWSASVTANMVGRHSTSDGVHIDSWTTADLQASWSGWRGITVVGGIRNLGDRDPPLGLPFTFYSVAGRVFYVRLQARWP